MDLSISWGRRWEFLTWSYFWGVFVLDGEEIIESR
ncbi:uncharacterized protein METZ01_LOCUS322741 [marine metagenome]|uniref:Uncharacterized protein n=1 Tax=marine metagenome TaxID=408172 RepID=A0A382PAL6_9ZZZZ